MISDSQILVVVGFFFLFVTFSPLLAVAVHKYVHAHKMITASVRSERYRLEIALINHMGGHLRFFVIIGVIVFTLMASAITAYWFLANPHNTDIPKTMFYFTSFGYALYVACKFLSVMIIVQGSDVDAALYISVLALFITIWLVVSLAYTVGKYHAGSQAGIIYTLVIFILMFLWQCWYVYFVSAHRKHSECLRVEVSRRGAGGQGDESTEAFVTQSGGSGRLLGR